MVYSYLGGVALLVAYLWSLTLLDQLDSEQLAAILDPFAMGSYFIITEYWTPAELNTLSIPLSGSFLLNRVLWVSLGVALMGFTFWRFRLDGVVDRASIIKRGKRLGEEKKTMFQL